MNMVRLIPKTARDALLSNAWRTAQSQKRSERPSLKDCAKEQIIGKASILGTDLRQHDVFEVPWETERARAVARHV
jgi:hypothetical protein